MVRLSYYKSRLESITAPLGQCYDVLVHHNMGRKIFAPCGIPAAKSEYPPRFHPRRKRRGFQRGFDKKSMKNLMRYAVTAMLCALLASPFAAVAQTIATSSDTISSSTNQWYREGSSEPISVRRERIRGYRQQSSELQQKIIALGSTANASVLMPVLFGVGVKDISPNFGDPRSGGRTHEGEDIMAVKGTPIISPTPAVVLRIGAGETEGNYVYTANPGGETFIYMHLDRIGEGVISGLVLGQGSLIGYVGNTGNASGGPAHLHFEIRKDRVAADPFPRLTKEFTLKEKMEFLEDILDDARNEEELAKSLVANYLDTFIRAQAEDIQLPQDIIDAGVPRILSESSQAAIRIKLAALIK